MKNAQHILFLRKKYIEPRNLALSKNTHSSHWIIYGFLLVSETPVVITVPTNTSGGRRQSWGSLQAKSTFLSQLSLSFRQNCFLAWNYPDDCIFHFPPISVCTTLRLFFTIEKLWRKHQIKKEHRKIGCEYMRIVGTIFVTFL